MTIILADEVDSGRGKTTGGRCCSLVVFVLLRPFSMFDQQRKFHNTA